VLCSFIHAKPYLLLCVNLTGLRDAQIAGKILSGCACEGGSRRDSHLNG
jgi:hypothetical protein